MSTQMLYAYEHASTRTLIRAVCSGGVVQLIRDGVLLATYSLSLNGQVELAENGLLAWETGYSNLECVNLNRRFPQEPRELGDAKRISVRGDQLLAYPYVDPDEVAYDEIVTTALNGAKRRTWWRGDTTKPRPVDLTRRKSIGAPKSGFERLTSPEIAMAADGETWALLAADRAELGRGAKSTASIAWEEGSVDWWPSRYTFDLPRGRLLLAGRPGVTAIALAGGDVLAYGNLSSVGPCVSAPCLYRDELLVVVGRDGVGMVDHEVYRLDPETLAPRGRMLALPTRRDEDSHGLLVLADGSLAWVRADSTITIVPAAGSPIAATSLIDVVGAARAPAFAAPRAPRANESKHAACARELLEECTDRRAIAELFASNLEAFAPLADGILAWDAAQLTRLATLERQTWWQLGRGASDEAVDRLIEQITRPAASADATRVATIRRALLIGVDTAHSRSELGRLARRDKSLRALSRERLFEIPKQGPAIRRFDPQRQAIVPHRSGTLASFPKRPILAAGWSCDQAPYNLLTVGRHHFLQSGCEDCDESMAGYVLKTSGKKVELVGTTDGGKKRPKTRCPGSGQTMQRSKNYALVAPRKAAGKAVGFVGGQPNWWQSPAPPDCPKCRRLMFFAAELHAARISSDVPDNAIYAFECESCRIATHVVQCT